jgi:hypothetical protein
MAATTTRTLNPLPFTDLEPKRFEDLVRQLVYDFRPWRRLEATGRSGSDDGFDARGLEIVQDATPTAVPVDDEAGEDAEEAGLLPDRLWLIQCKREKSIPPAKLKGYLADIKLRPEEKLHGIIFAAACDFSKMARDLFLAWCRDQGISEAFLWGKGELEDQLFQPKNDNLLFAYFGISLTIRRRSQATQIRAEIATKRKLTKTVGTSSAEILIRDPSDTAYPAGVAKGKRPEKWRVYHPEKITHRGLEVSVYWFHAYLDPATGEWDAADLIPARHMNDPWKVEDPEKEKLDRAASQIWHALPDDNKAWLKVTGIIPFANIVAIDDMGDDLLNGTHIFAPFKPNKGPFDYFLVKLKTVGFKYGKQRSDMDPTKRICVADLTKKTASVGNVYIRSDNIEGRWLAGRRWDNKIRRINFEKPVSPT